MTVSAHKGRACGGDALVVHLELEPDRVELRLSGVFVIGGRTLFEGFAASACNAGRPLVVMDLAELKHCDLAGLSGLLRAVEVCRRSGRLVAVIGASQELRHAFDRADLHDVLVKGEEERA